MYDGKKRGNDDNDAADGIEGAMPMSTAKVKTTKVVVKKIEMTKEPNKECGLWYRSEPTKKSFHTLAFSP